MIIHPKANFRFLQGTFETRFVVKPVRRKPGDPRRPLAEIGDKIPFETRSGMNLIGTVESIDYLTGALNLHNCEHAEG